MPKNPRVMRVETTKQKVTKHMQNAVQMASGDALVLQCSEGGNFIKHPPGIYQAVCVDVIDLGLQWSEYQGKRKLVRKLMLVFETEHIGEDGKRGIVTKKFSASIYPQAKLAAFLGQWRGRPIVPGDSVDLKKVQGACGTLVLSHQQSLSGRTYVSIDAVSKAAKQVTPSGQYDPAAMRQRIAEWAAKDQAAEPRPGIPAYMPSPTVPVAPVTAVAAVTAPLANTPAAPLPYKSDAGATRTAAANDFDPEVGF